ncbi:MAG: DUF2029 domain-containing protein [Acidobacteria bacterium]|nr:DUF2029 domain-containing protein [Acidobacteriota bacterium]
MIEAGAPPQPVSFRAMLAVLLAGTLISLGFGFQLKDACTSHAWDGYQYRHSCYNDVYALYFFRALKCGRFPYVSGDGKDVAGPETCSNPRFDADLEYPVGTGLWAGAMARLVRHPPPRGQPADANASADGQRFFRANALGLALFGLGAVVLLAAMARDRRRVLLFALSPTLVLYGFHNWDLLAIGLATGAFFAFSRRSDSWAGALLGLGAATKLYPGFFLPALVAARWRENRRMPWSLIGWSAFSFAWVNLPVLLLNPRGWIYPWRFQATRFPNFENVWYFVYRHFGSSAAGGFWWKTYPRLTGLLSGLLFAAGLALLLRAELRRERVRPFALSLGILLWFLLTAKVYSPQYTLWVIPFFVLVEMPWQGYVLLVATDAGVWFGISSYFIAVQHHTGDPAWRLSVTEFFTFARYAVIAWLLWR